MARSKARTGLPVCFGAGDKGTGVFLHGFPEIWYSWRHQMVAVAAAGYRAVAPDWRGYGLSDQPPVEEEVSYDDLLDDLLGILDALSVPKVSGSPLPQWVLVHTTSLRSTRILAVNCTHLIHQYGTIMTENETSNSAVSSDRLVFLHFDGGSEIVFLSSL